MSGKRNVISSAAGEILSTVRGARDAGELEPYRDAAGAARKERIRVALEALLSWPLQDVSEGRTVLVALSVREARVLEWAVEFYMASDPEGERASKRELEAIYVGRDRLIEARRRAERLIGGKP
jgi:hypothetical protein